LPWIVRAARSSPFIAKVAKNVKLAKKDSMIRAVGHERGVMRPVSGGGGHGSIKPAAS
jgi:hypothetical protein